MGKPKVISMDIGFDRDASPKRSHPEEPEREAYPILRCGLTQPNLTGNPVALSADIVTRDEIVFNIWDITNCKQKKDDEIVPVPIEYRKMSLRLMFQPAREGQKDVSPFQRAEGSISGEEYKLYEEFCLVRALNDKAYSTVFECDAPLWRVHSPGFESCNARRFPANQLRHEPRTGQSSAYEVVTKKNFFYLTITLDVTWREGGAQGPASLEISKRFRVDPEMIIDNNGIPPDEEPPGK